LNLRSFWEYPTKLAEVVRVIKQSCGCFDIVSLSTHLASAVVACPMGIRIFIDVSPSAKIVQQIYVHRMSSLRPVVFVDYNIFSCRQILYATATLSAGLIVNTLFSSVSILNLLRVSSGRNQCFCCQKSIGM
jgi:hypothetical protein